MNNDDIYELAEKHGAWSMSDFQSRYFVVNSQVTNYRRVRQALLEIETRIAAKKQMERNVKKTEIEKKISQREFDNERDELKRELIALDIEQFDYDLSVYKKKYKVCLEELDNFAKIIHDIVPDLENLNKFKEHDEVQERNYWITRMAKQASMDLMTIGRIGSGNLDSIAMMPIDDQMETIGAALKYSSLLTKGISLLEKKAIDDIALSPEMKYIDDVVKQQLKIENKNQGENI